MVLLCCNILTGPLHHIFIPVVFGEGEDTSGLWAALQSVFFLSWVWSMFVTMSVKLVQLCMTSPPSCFHTAWWFVILKHFLPLSLCVSLRTSEAGCPLYNRAEGGHKDCQQGETLWISSNEGTVPVMYPIYLCAVSLQCSNQKLAPSSLMKSQQKWSLYFSQEKPVCVL